MENKYQKKEKNKKEQKKLAWLLAKRKNNILNILA